MTKREYSNSEITIVWQPDLCIHAAHCRKQLPQVFDPQKRPWVDALGASTKQLIAQVEKCPSGALSYYTNDGKTPVSHKKETGEKASEWISVEIIENGPLYLFGNVRIKDKRKEETIREEKAAFCRCGASRDKPFCDGSHLKINFKG
jgi:uncharacterized Fe-S cluster protein YjdI